MALMVHNNKSISNEHYDNLLSFQVLAPPNKIKLTTNYDDNNNEYNDANEKEE